MAIKTYLSTIESKKQNKQAEQKQTHRYMVENILTVARWNNACHL